MRIIKNYSSILEANKKKKEISNKARKKQPFQKKALYSWYLDMDQSIDMNLILDVFGELKDDYSIDITSNIKTTFSKSVGSGRLTSDSPFDKFDGYSIVLRSIDKYLETNISTELILGLIRRSLTYYYQETGIEIFAVYLPSDFNSVVGLVFPITFLRLEVYPYLFLNKLVAIKRNEDTPKLNESNSNKEFVDTDIIMDVLSEIKDDHDIEIVIYDELGHIGVKRGGSQYRFCIYMIRLKGSEKLDNLLSIVKKSVEYYYQETGDEIACVIFEYKGLNNTKHRLLYDIDVFRIEFLNDIYLENRKDYLYVTKDESGNLDDLDYNLPTKSTITIVEGKFNI